MTHMATGTRDIPFKAEIGPCAMTLEPGNGCAIDENGEKGTPIDEQTLREHLEGPGGSEDVVALIEDRTGAIDPTDRKTLLDALDEWKQRRYE
jgi:hypothetical protein